MVCVLFPLTTGSPVGAMLRSPWDDQPAVAGPDRSAGQAGSLAGACPTPPELPTDSQIADYYSDRAHSEIDAERKEEYDNATAAFRESGHRLEAMADQYRRGEDMEPAVCATSWLMAFANRATLLGASRTNQAVYVQGWMLGVYAIAALKVRSWHATASPVSAWLAGLAEQQIAYYQPRSAKVDGRNNHRYWAGFGVMAAGIAADRSDLFNWGVESFRLGVAQIADNGTLPLELARQTRALHYHLFAAAPLVLTAELAASNGCALYAEHRDRLASLIDVTLRGVENPNLFADLAGFRQVPPGENELVWVKPFAQRFHQPLAQKILARQTSETSLYLGGTAPPARAPGAGIRCPAGG